MPRKAKPGPHIKRIESMSTGQEYRPPQAPMFDELGTGEEIKPVMAKLGPNKVLPSAQELRDMDNRAKREGKRKLLQTVGILPKASEAKLVAPKVEGKRAVVSKTMATYHSLPAWRRDWG